jgi:predicted Zn-dependent protease
VKHLLHIVLLALVLIACTTPSDVRVRPAYVAPSAGARAVLVDRTFGPDIPEIVGGVDAWNYALQGQLVLRAEVSDLTIPEMASGAILIMRVDSSCTFIPFARGRVLAWADQIGGRKVWLLRDRMRPEQVRAVTMHELGHVLGALDREGPGLMHWSLLPEEYRCVDRATALEVVAAMHLGEDRLAYCVAP